MDVIVCSVWKLRKTTVRSIGIKRSKSNDDGHDDDDEEKDKQAISFQKDKRDLETVKMLTSKPDQIGSDGEGIT